MEQIAKYVLDVVNLQLYKCTKRGDTVYLDERKTKKTISTGHNNKYSKHFTMDYMDYLEFLGCGVFQPTDRNASIVDNIDGLELFVKRSTREKFEKYITEANIAVFKKMPKQDAPIKFVLGETENEK